MRVSISGTRDGAEWPPIGSVVELPDTEAVALLNAGMVAAAQAEVETAAMPAPKRTRKRPA